MNGWARMTYPKIPWREYDLGLLVSFFYLKHFNQQRMAADCPRFMLDSGAFSAWNSGKTIDLSRLEAEARRERWGSVVTLDVIGNPELSKVNAWRMRQRVGSHVMPVFHIGEPMELLADYCHYFGYVGLSCRFGESVPQSLAWLNDCFRQSYPHRFHSFGWVDDKALRTYPFYSADAVTWAMAPPTYGRWAKMGQLRVREKVSLLAQVKEIAEYQARLRGIWAQEMRRWSN